MRTSRLNGFVAPLVLALGATCADVSTAIAGPITAKDWKPADVQTIPDPPLLPDPLGLPPGVVPSWVGQGIVSVSPAMGLAGTQVVIRGKRAFGPVTAVRFGALPAYYFNVQADGTIVAGSPAGVPGSNVSVAVVEGVMTWTSAAAYTYPIAQMQVTGPLPYNPSDDDKSWYNGTGHVISVDAPPTLSVATPPVLHVLTTSSMIPPTIGGTISRLSRLATTRSFRQNCGTAWWKRKRIPWQSQRRRARTGTEIPATGKMRAGSAAA